MSADWVTAGVLAAGCAVLKGAGPMLLSGRSLPKWLDELATRLPAPLLAALTVVASLDADRLRPDARLVGLAAAAIALWRRAGFVVVVLVAAAATAATRALT